MEKLGIFNIPLTAKELKSLDDYSGYKHTKINILSDLDPQKIKELKLNGWDLDISAKDLEELIEDFVNIYGAIYNCGYRKDTGTLYRGTNKKEIIKLSKEKEINQIISTTVSEEISKRFCEYENAAIIRIRTEEGLSNLYLENFKNDDKGDEKEVLILPFSRVKNIEHVSDWNGYSYYSQTLEKGNLPEIEHNELLEMKEQNINEFEKYMNTVKEVSILEDESGNLQYQMKKQGLSYEDMKYISERQDNIYRNIKQLNEFINNYKLRFQNMLKGLCKEREKEIDKEKQEILEIRKKEEQEIEAIRIQKLKQDIDNLKIKNSDEMLDLSQCLGSCEKQLEQIIDKYGKVRKDLEIGDFVDHRMEMDILNRINEIKEKLEYDRNKQIPKENTDLDIVYEEEKGKSVKIEETKKIVEDIEKSLVQYDRENFKDIKYNLNIKVRDLIYRHEIYRLQCEKQEIEEEKEGILKRIFLGKKLKKAKIDNIDAKMSLEKRKKQNRNPENKVRSNVARNV